MEGEVAIPHLCEQEEAEEEQGRYDDVLPSHYEIILVGTGLTQSILSRSDKSVSFFSFIC